MPGRVWGRPGKHFCNPKGRSEYAPQYQVGRARGVMGWAAGRYLNVPRACWFLPRTRSSRSMLLRWAREFMRRAEGSAPLDQGGNPRGMSLQSLSGE